MKKTYVEADLKIVSFCGSDVITTSGNDELPDSWTDD